MQQSPSTPTPPAPAQAPTPPAPARVGPGGVRVQTSTEGELTRILDPLYRRRAELGSQLEQLKDRREELVDQMEEMRSDQQGGHLSRIKVIDDRSANLERELYRLDDQIARTLATGEIVAEEGRPVTSQTLTEPDFLREVRRAASNGGEDAALGALAGTGTFLFFGISEAQRYVARLLNERALGAGEAQPVHSRGAAKADPVERL
jgi:hypothetical protein